MIDVWVFWEGPRPLYIDLCLRTIRLCCNRNPELELHVLDSRMFEKTIGDRCVNSNWKGIQELGVTSDVVRAALLARFGGIYLDADTVCLGNPADMYDAERFCYSTWTTPPDRVIAGYVASPPDSAIAQGWLERVNEVLSRGAKHATWLALGECCLTPVVRQHEETSKKLPLDMFLPIEIDKDVNQFFCPGDFRRFITENTRMFGLNHSWFMSRKPHEMTQERWRDGQLVIHSLLRYAEDMLC